MKRILNLIKVILIKLKYRRNLVIEKDGYRSYIYSKKNIKIIKGRIKFGRITTKPNVMIAVNDGGKIDIGNNTTFNNNTIVAAFNEIKIGDNCSIGPDVCIYDHDHAFNENGKINKKHNVGTVIIGNNVWIAAGVIILRNTTIGDNCVIGAGTIVKGNIEPNSLVTSDRSMIIKKLEKRN